MSDVVREVELGEGRRLVVRHGGPEDAPAVVALYDRLSRSDLSLRFFSAHRPSDAFVERWMSSDERGGAVLVAEIEVEGGPPLVVAEAGYAPLADGDAELGITVDPEWRGWLGPWLLDTLVEVAHDRGVANLEAEILLRNRPMRELIRHRGYAVAEHPDWEVVRLVIATEGRTPGWAPASDRPHVLVTSPGGRWAGEAAAREAGFDVRLCPGPDGPVPHCPALEGKPCPLVEGADALVLALPPGDERTEGLLAEHRRRRPDLVVVRDDEADHGCRSATRLVEALVGRLAGSEPDRPEGSDE